MRGEQPLELHVGMLPRTVDSRIDPAEEAVLAEPVGLAFYLVWTFPPRRSARRHLRGPFDAIAAILGRSTAAAKMLASRPLRPRRAR